MEAPKLNTGVVKLVRLSRINDVYAYTPLVHILAALGLLDNTKHQHVYIDISESIFFRFLYLCAPRSCTIHHAPVYHGCRSSGRL